MNPYVHEQHNDGLHAFPTQTNHPCWFTICTWSFSMVRLILLDVKVVDFCQTFGPYRAPCHSDAYILVSLVLLPCLCEHIYGFKKKKKHCSFLTILLYASCLFSLYLVCLWENPWISCVETYGLVWWKPWNINPLCTVRPFNT